MANPAGLVSLFRQTSRPLQIEPESICRAVDSPPAPVQDMGVDHRRAHVLVAEPLLDRPNTRAAFEQVCGKGMSECVACGPLGEPGLRHSVSDGFLHQ